MKMKYTPALLLGADLLALVLTFCLSYGVVAYFSEHMLGREFMSFEWHDMRGWLSIFVMQMIACMTLFGAKGHYTQHMPWWEQVKYMVIVNTIMMLLSTTVLYALKLPFSRLWIAAAFLLAVPMLIIMRLVARQIAISFKQWATDVIIVGGPENVMEAIFALNSDHYNLYNVREVHLLGTRSKLDPELLPARQRGCKQALTRLEQLPGIVEKSDRDVMFIAAPDESTMLDLSGFLAMAHDAERHAAFIPPMSGLSLYGMEMQHFFGSHTVLLKPKRRMEKPLNRVFKRALDLFGAVVGMLVLAGPILFIALMIRRDGGSPFYYQKRVGRKGRMFKCWKLRSMVMNSKEVLEELLATDPEARKEFEKDFKLKNDPRITKIGHIIRKTSIDELPQLWNVLRGEMSLVGPRPIVTEELEYYGLSKDDYLSAKPGLTGLWQVSGRNDTSYAYRVYLDSWYVAHWSIWTDIVIIIETVGILLSRKGAY